MWYSCRRLHLVHHLLPSHHCHHLYLSHRVTHLRYRLCHRQSRAHLRRRPRRHLLSLHCLDHPICQLHSHHLHPAQSRALSPVHPLDPHFHCLRPRRRRCYLRIHPDHHRLRRQHPRQLLISSISDTNDHHMSSGHQTVRCPMLVCWFIALMEWRMEQSGGVQAVPGCLLPSFLRVNATSPGLLSSSSLRDHSYLGMHVLAAV
mmetsp:Transcript_25983/g.66013  ORF Transcript_25983/g.66013 Transcript_25983/m.66013 type:complete len:203 (+) Transcript_25983:89-697(+)